MRWQCKTCGKEHDELPLCLGVEAPWRAIVPEEEFSTRVELNKDQCVVDNKMYFVRGHIVIPIHDFEKQLEFSVWSSLSEKSFMHMCQRWEATDRQNDPPYFGWLSSELPVYPMRDHLKVSVQSRAPGFCPLFTVEPTAHPLAVDLQHGISIDRWHEIVHALMGDAVT